VSTTPERKLARMKPIVRVRKIQLDQESLELAKIRQEKTEKMQELRGHQREYMLGIDKLNAERSASEPRMLEVLENSVDYVKNRWQHCIRELRLIEEKERAQIANTLTADRGLKSVQKLEDRYRFEARSADVKREQKELDEIVLRKFHTESRS
jgi:flagellar export protein FliJ